MAGEEADLRVAREGALGRLTLNRPRALNALTLGMVRGIARALDGFERDAGVAVVLLDGAGERGLCAGGDILAIHASGRANGGRGDGEAERFWREEYALDARLKAYAKPYVAIMDGLVMGGGVGLSGHGRHRVVTERTRIAMPEVGIGFVPDVGGTWLLSRGSGEVGTYLALSGEPIGAGDAIHAGLADLFVPSGRLPALRAVLARAPSPEAVPEILAAHAEPAPPAPLAAEEERIARLFAGDDVRAILARLAADDSAFAAAAREAVSARSPTSLAVTLRLLRFGRAAPRLETCLAREYRAACRTLREPDFYEGVRAAVIDKDRRPAWSPARLEDLDPARVEAHFAPPSGPEPFPEEAI